MGRISMFCGTENYVLLYKSVYYEVITDYGKLIQYSVFSFLALRNFWCIMPNCRIL